MENTQKNKLIEMAPTMAFVAGYFVFHLFDWMEVTQIIWAVWVSLAMFLFLAADLKMEHKGKTNFSKLNFYSGLLSLISVIILLQGFVHWNRLLPQVYRMSLLISLLLIFFFVVFRGMRVMKEWSNV